MKRIYTFVIINVWLGALIAQNPITLSNNNMPASGDTLRYTGFQVASAGNYSQTGVNMFWDFSQVVSTTEGIRSFKNALQTPYSILFGFNAYGEKIADTLGAGPLVLSDYYNFYKKQTSPVNAFIADGVGMTYSNIPIPNYYSDKDELYIFPLTFPQYDSTTFKFSTTTAGFIPITYSKAGYRVTRVDGWGTVSTPYGTENCLRVVTTQYATDSIKNSFVPIPLAFPNYQRSYQWLTLTSKIPFLEISGSLLGDVFTPTQGRYRVYEKENNPVGVSENTFLPLLKFYPNPVKNTLHLVLPGSGAVEYSLYNAEGRLLEKQGVNRTGGELHIALSERVPGIYLLRLHTAEGERQLRFVKE